MKLSKVLNSFKINNENKIKVIGLLTILIAFWLVFYFIPEIFVSLFHTFLGNLILIVSVLLIYMNNRLYGLMIGLVLLVLFRFSQLSNQKQREHFSLNINGTFEIDDETLQNGAGLTADSKLNFLRIQDTINKQKVFDMNVLETQATQEELDYFNKHGKWPWSRRVINLYKESVRNNPFIRTVPEQAANYARTIYNQSAILRLLSYQTKEGDFLLNGVLVKDPSGNSAEDLPSGFGEFGYSSGLLGNRSYDVIKCNLKDDSNPKLERIRYTGKGGIFGEQTEKVSDVSYNELEKIVPRFKFLSSPCNPCKAMSATPDYSCPFRLKVKNKSPFISSVWQYLWGLNDNPLESHPSFITETVNPNEFPLLSELQSELQRQSKYQI
jgi:hypothetical protein